MNKEQQKVAIIYNPASGIKTKEEVVDGIAKELQAKGARVEIFSTCKPGDATELASKAVRKGCSIVFAAGGDGTLNEVGKGLVNRDAVLGCIPFGTLNIWASETGLSKKPEKVADLMVNGQIKTIDTGKINDNPFILFAGVGFDAEVARRVQEPNQGKKRKGIIQYIEHALKIVPYYSEIPAEIIMDGQKMEMNLFQVIFGNTRQWASFVLRKKGRCNDGWLELTTFSDNSDQGLFLPLKSSNFQGRKFTIDLTKPVAIEVDGEPLEEAGHIEVRVVPSSLKVLVPGREMTVFSKR